MENGMIKLEYSKKFVFDKKDVIDEIKYVLSKKGTVLFSYNGDYPELCEEIKNDIEIFFHVFNEDNRNGLIYFEKFRKNGHSKGTAFSSRFDLIVIDNLFINNVEVIKAEIETNQYTTKHELFYISNRQEKCRSYNILNLKLN